MKKIRVFVCVIFISIVASLFSGCVAKVAVPKIKEGRFDFSVTYEVNGQEETYTGVYVCEYDGVYITCLGGSIQWKGYVENGENVMAIHTNEYGVVYIDFGFIPEYFMNDPDAICYDVPSPDLYMIYNDDDPDVTSSMNEADVIASYGVRIISYEYAKPIENTFEEKLKFGKFEPTIN